MEDGRERSHIASAPYEGSSSDCRSRERESKSRRDEESTGKKIRKQLEIDFVCNKGSGRLYIQSAYSLPDEEKRIQETRPFSKIKDAFKRIIITGDMISPHYDEEGVLMLSIYDFLLDPSVMER